MITRRQLLTGFGATGGFEYGSLSRTAGQRTAS
jgi:hypothetical protein